VKQVPLLFVAHNHQPVGNFDWVIEECYEQAYRPFIEVLARHPKVRVGLHYTGPVLEWIDVHRPEFFALVRRLVARGQVEILGGGYYEPILPVIPERDRLGQLELMQREVQDRFGAQPIGGWLAERVWEPTLPPVLRQAGLHYVLIDDEAFHRLGYSEIGTCASFMTEDQGEAVCLLPINRRLRYTIPGQPANVVADVLREMIADGAQTLIYADDGERFGAWPGTYDYMYGDEAYLDTLFTALEALDDVRSVLPGEYLKQYAPSGLVYLPPTSYAEMLEWSDGFWRHFLTRFRESNQMHKKVLQVSAWVAEAEAAGCAVEGAKRDLYAAQCNCSYWYGVFGGLYLPHLRRAIYQHALRAERAIAARLPRELRGSCDVVDANYDGHHEVLLRDGELTVGITPAHGGAVYTLEHLGLTHNFLDTLARYPLRQAAEIPTPVDWHPRYACLDHILDAATTIDDVADGCYRDLGDFVLEPFSFQQSDDGDITLVRHGHFWEDQAFVPLTVAKRYNLHHGLLQVQYTLTNPADTARTFRFAVEVNGSLTAGHAPDRTLRVRTPDGDETLPLDARRSLPVASAAVFRDDWLEGSLAVAWTQPTSLWVFPIATPLRTLEGLEWVYQSTVVLPIWDVALEAGASWSVSLTLRAHALAEAGVTA
jgi:alpha-amylase